MTFENKTTPVELNDEQLCNVCGGTRVVTKTEKRQITGKPYESPVSGFKTTSDKQA